MNYPSTHELDQLSQRLTHLLGYVPKDTEVINLTFELEWIQYPLSDCNLLQRYQRIQDFHAAQS